MNQNEILAIFMDKLNIAQRYILSNFVRVAGIEPTSAAWEAAILPLNYTRS